MDDLPGDDSDLGDETGYPPDLFSEKPDDILICVVCNRITEDAHECPCGHLFCGTHIRRWLATGNRSCPTCRTPVDPADLKSGGQLHLAYRRQLGALSMRCPHFKRGCTISMPIASYRSHLATCSLAPVMCRFKGCPMAIPPAGLNREDLQQHEENCPFRVVVCPLPDCGQSIMVRDMSGHTLVCQDVRVVCPIKGCRAVLTRGMVEAHLEDTVAMRAHIRHLSRQVSELERPIPVDRELVLRIPDIKQKLANQEFSYWSPTHMLKIPGLGLGGYSFQLAVALKPPVDARGCVLAMFLHIKTGNYDALLKWPFPIPFTLTVLDQRDPDATGPARSLEHISRKIESPSEQVADSTYLRPGGGGWGYPQITGYDKLLQGGYTASGAMFVRVTFHFEDCFDGIEALTI